MGAGSCHERRPLPFCDCHLLSSSAIPERVRATSLHGKTRFILYGEIMIGGFRIFTDVGTGRSEDVKTNDNRAIVFSVLLQWRSSPNRRILQ